MGVANVELEKSNASEHGAYSTYYDDELLALVTGFYRRDFEDLDYPVAATLETLPCA